MSLVSVAETSDLIVRRQVELSEADKEFVLQFAFSTRDKELTNKLIDELVEKDVDKGAVLRKYSVMTGFQPDWVKKIENLLVALEMYRIQEEKAIQTLSEILAVCGTDLTVADLKRMPADEVREHLEQKEVLVR